MDHDVQTRQQLWGKFEPKQAEAARTHVMPRGAPTKTDKGSLATIPKVGAVEGAPEGVEAAEVKGEQPAQHPQSKPLSPRVDVSGKEPPKVIKEKQAQHYALPSLGRYSLDSYSEVEKAADYFGEWGKQFIPAHRHEFCVNLVKRASALSIPVSEEIQKYGSVTYDDPERVQIGIDSRRSLLQGDSDLAVLDKLAEARPTLAPDEFAEVLHQFDKVAGLDYLYDADVIDPYFTTFGLQKTAAEPNDADTQIIGNDVITNKQLRLLSKSPCKEAEGMFGEDFVKEFKKDPIGIFKSMPMDQKKILGRMANDLESV